MVPDGLSYRHSRSLWTQCHDGPPKMSVARCRPYLPPKPVARCILRIANDNNARYECCVLANRRLNMKRVSQSYFLLPFLATLLIAAVFNVDSAQAQATRTWVSGVGDDANPCSRTAPCKTFA